MCKTRCSWATGGSDEYIHYHDVEWGVPTRDDQTLFEFLILEGAQAGLSWSTILHKRDGYRTAFANFDVHQVASFTEDKIQELIQYEGIVRNKLKIRSAVNNAQRFIEVQKEFGSFDAYIWSFTNHQVITNEFKDMKDVPAHTEISDAMSKDLKKRGFKFVGSTIMYAYMQSMGMVNDHTVDCFRYKEVLEE